MLRFSLRNLVIFLLRLWLLGHLLMLTVVWLLLKLLLLLLLLITTLITIHSR